MTQTNSSQTSKTSSPSSMHVMTIPTDWGNHTVVHNVATDEVVELFTYYRDAMHDPFKGEPPNEDMEVSHARRVLNLYKHNYMMFAHYVLKIPESLQLRTNARFN